MNKLLKDNSYSQPLLFNGAKTEREFSGQQVESKSDSCPQKSKSQDGGYTIIESLVAMIVVSVLMIAIAPVMAFSVATRVQARRMELATQAARTYIDGLRSQSIKFEDPNNIPGFPTEFRATTPAELANAPAPAGTNNLYCVDMDETPGCDPKSTKDFYVQGVWRNPDRSIPNSDPTSKGYQLLVRVYRADSFDGVDLQDPRDARKQSVVGSGLGDRTMPVVEMSTEIPASGNPSYRSIYDRLQQR